MKVFALFSIKGGVGKTSTAVNLAHLAAREGAPTLICDFDPQGAASFHFRIRPEVRGGAKRLLGRRGAFPDAIRATDYDLLDLLPADFSYRHFDIRLDRADDPQRHLARLVEDQGQDYEYAFLDCAPGASLVSENIFSASNVLLVPTIPTVLSLRTLARLLQHLKDRAPEDLRILPFFSMVDGRKALHRKVCAWAEAKDLGFLQTRIPYSSNIELMSVRRTPLVEYASGSPASRAYEKLWEEIRERLRQPPRAHVDTSGVSSMLDDLRANGRGSKR